MCVKKKFAKRSLNRKLGWRLTVGWSLTKKKFFSSYHIEFLVEREKVMQINFTLDGEN